MATTNVTGFQTFAISSGTSGCSNDGLFWADHKVDAYVVANYDDLARDIAQGQGEHLTSLATLMGVLPESHAEFFAMAQREYRTFGGAGAQSLLEWIQSIREGMAQHQALTVYSLGR